MPKKKQSNNNRNNGQKDKKSDKKMHNEKQPSISQENITNNKKHNKKNNKKQQSDNSSKELVTAVTPKKNYIFEPSLIIDADILKQYSDKKDIILKYQKFVTDLHHDRVPNGAHMKRLASGVFSVRSGDKPRFLIHDYIHNGLTYPYLLLEDENHLYNKYANNPKEVADHLNLERVEKSIQE